ncbi:MAG: hypothetical protein A3B69_05675 [Gammaproteobacteria bacterium RIFCSPHIGHO2_02_FULL_38_33]|nr:MAG: hypothetical protein A3B69_05675 [Gammaproteobacteria bacterium RIFCSPHIGHO2_02_FULL_38_33]
MARSKHDFFNFIFTPLKIHSISKTEILQNRTYAKQVFSHFNKTHAFKFIMSMQQTSVVTQLQVKRRCFA